MRQVRNKGNHMQRKLQLATAIAAALAAGSATAQTRLDVQQQAVNAINNDRAAQQSVLKLAGVAAPDGWRVKAVKITRLKASDVQLKMPPQSRVPLTSTEIVNCDALQLYADLRLRTARP